jgi:hypothetical protein
MKLVILSDTDVPVSCMQGFGAVAALNLAIMSNNIAGRTKQVIASSLVFMYVKLYLRYWPLKYEIVRGPQGMLLVLKVRQNIEYILLYLLDHL